MMYGPERECVAEFDDHEDSDSHDYCADMLRTMSGDDFDYIFIDYPEYDAQYYHFERFGRPAFPNEY